VRETGLAVSICAHAILRPGLTVIPDTRLEPCLAGNPLVHGPPHLRFYAGAPLLTLEELPLGTLCVLDYVPRPQGLTPRQAATLQAFARQIMVQLELRLAVRRHAEAEAEKDRLLHEKDMLIQEVHHRVRNSLQLVQNLLSLQSRAAENDEVADHLRQSAGRVRTIGMIHDRLHSPGGLGLDIEIRSYLGGLIEDLRAAMTSSLDGRALLLQADAANWPAAAVPTLGLVATELVTNALKYGSGDVRVNFRQPEGEQAVLVVEDAGSGPPEGFEPAASRGLGMRIVCGLLRTGGAGLELDRSVPHTRFVARLPRAA
jgi:two-component sensor histidine kinase